MRTEYRAVRVHSGSFSETTGNTINLKLKCQISIGVAYNDEMYFKVVELSQSPSKVRILINLKSKDSELLFYFSK